MTALAQFTELELDALREVANIGCGHAATVLSQMIGAPIAIDVPQLSWVPSAHVMEGVAESGERVVGLTMQIVGDLMGETRFVVRESHARILVDLLMGQPLGTGGLDDAMEQSCLMEAGNVMASGFLNALAVFLNRCLLPSPPSLVISSPRELAPGDVNEEVLVATTTFRFEDQAHAAHQAQGAFLFTLGAAARGSLFEALRHFGVSSTAA